MDVHFAGLPSAEMMLAYGLHDGRLRPLFSDRFGKANFLADMETVEFPVGNAIAVKVDLAAISRGNEPMVVLGHERKDYAVRRFLVGFDVTLPLADKILQLAAGYVERVSDGHPNVFVPACGPRVATDGDIGGAGNREVETDTIGIAFVMAMLRPPNNNARRCDAITELLELFGLFARALFDIVDVRNVLEGNLQGNLHANRPLYGECYLIQINAQPVRALDHRQDRPHRVVQKSHLPPPVSHPP
jgi:hypothetical protein